MAYTTINKPGLYFNTVLYTGNGSTLNVTGVGFQPDFVWIKCRGTAYNHRLYDSVRGVLKSVNSNLTAQEETTVGGVSAYNADGYTNIQNADSESNNNGVNYCSWNWKANGAGSSNNSGTITSTVSANTTAGFSIVGYTGNGVSGATVGHGLGVTPAMIIQKRRTGALANWRVWNGQIFATSGVTDTLFFNSTSASGAESDNISGVSSTTFTVRGTGAVNESGSPMVAYCFSEIKGYSKFGKYTGNGSTDGPFVYTGFKPAMIIAKRTDSTGNWRIRDNKRSPFNVITDVLYPNTANTTITEDDHDFLSNGFKVRTTGPENNASGGTYIYMAFAENPFVSSTQIPTTAR